MRHADTYRTNYRCAVEIGMQIRDLIYRTFLSFSRHFDDSNLIEDRGEKQSNET